MKEQNLKKRVLFICIHNSARSQMAEGILNHIYGDKFEAFSAGIMPSKVNTYAIKVMAEIGIDISNHKSKHVDEFKGKNFYYVVAVCDLAKESCPFFSGSKNLHWNFTDPSSAKGNDEQRLEVFRKVRDEIKRKIEETFG